MEPIYLVFSLPVMIKCVGIVEIDTLSCAYNSWNVVYEFNSTKIFRSSLSTERFRPRSSLFSRPMSEQRNLANQRRIIDSAVLPSPQAVLMLEVASAALFPSLNSCRP